MEHLYYFSFTPLVIHINNSNYLTSYKGIPTAVSAGHQSKSCSVYKKCEDIFFLEPFYFVTIFLPRSFLKISEGHLQKNFEVENHLNPPKTAKSLKTTKKGSEHASLDILKALILIIFSHFFQVGAVHTTPKKSFFCKKIFSLNFFSNPSIK